MKRRMMVLAMVCTVVASGVAFGATKAEEQAEVKKAGEDALAALYKAAPSARKPSSPLRVTPLSATSE